jgi:hypothetical protein
VLEQVWSLWGAVQSSTRSISGHAGQEVILQSIAALPNTTVAAGTSTGAIQFYSMQDDDFACRSVLHAYT